MRDFDFNEFEPMGIVLKFPVKRRKVAALSGIGNDARPKKKPGGGGGGRSTVARIVAKAPEVMVKVSGRAKGFTHLREHLNYITRNGELLAETRDGSVYGRQEVGAVADDWWSFRGKASGFAEGSRRSSSKETVNLVLSMPEGTNRDKLFAAASAFASRTFAGNHDYLLAEHRDTKHPHVHLTVRALGDDEVRLNPKKADLQMWREGFALELRTQGLAAEATPRRARGVVQKGKSQAIKHLDQRGASKVQRAKVAQAVRDVAQRVDAGERPWEAATKKRQGMIRAAWGKIAEQFASEGGEGIELAESIRRFVAAMPPVETERQQIRRTVIEAAARQGGSSIDQTDRGSHEPER